MLRLKVVFMTFWQGLALKILAETTEVGGDGESADSWSEMVQNFLICLEMLLFSIAHFYCFPVEEWQPGYEAKYRKAKFGETMALNDFFTDLRIIMTAENNSSKKKKRSKRPSESTIAEEDGENVTQDDSVRSSAMDTSSVLTGDEEDPKQALVRAITSSVRSCSEDELSTSPNVHEAQERLGQMLDDMLFHYPQNSTQSSPRSTSVGLRVDEGGLNNVDDDRIQNFSNNNVEEIDTDGDTECPTKITGLLTGESATSLGNNLRPSIFTTISQQQSRVQAASKDENKELTVSPILEQQNEKEVDVEEQEKEEPGGKVE